MIITKKEFKDVVKKVIVDELKRTESEIRTSEATENLVTITTEYFEEVIRNLFCGDCWTYSRDALMSISNTILEDRLTFVENLGCVANTVLVAEKLEEKIKEEPQKKKEFDVEEILKEAGSEQE